MGRGFRMNKLALTICLLSFIVEKRATNKSTKYTRLRLSLCKILSS